MEVLGFISKSEKIIEADLEGVSPFDLDENAVEEARQIRQKLDALLA
jgi:hypothetical protein